MTPPLSDAESALLGLIGQGLNTLEISRTLNAKPYTIDRRTAALRRKLGAADIAQLREIAQRHLRAPGTP